jgi:hypothetical protein
MANLAEIKSKLGVETLQLNTVITEGGDKTPWLKQWDNTSRIAVLIHKDTLAKIKAKPSISTLGLNIQTKTGTQGEYTAKTICIYTESEETL